MGMIYPPFFVDVGCLIGGFFDCRHVIQMLKGTEKAVAKRTNQFSFMYLKP